MKNFMKKKFLIYGTSHKPLVGSKPLHIWFNKIDGFVRNYDKIWYSVLFGPEKYNAIYNRIRSFACREKTNIAHCSDNHYISS